MEFIKVLAQGGWIMIPLLAGSLVAVAIGIERFMFFSKQTLWNREEAQDWVKRISQDPQKAGKDLKEHSGLPTKTLKTACKNWELEPQVFAPSLEADVAGELPALQRYQGLLSTITTAAPLLGLLGTITGMMHVFQVVAEKLAQNPEADTTQITAGIGEALVATATGIFVALLSLFIHNYFQSRSEGVLDHCESLSLQLKTEHARKAK